MKAPNPEFTRTYIPIIGFGLYRLHIDQPWFHYDDYVEAIPDGPTKRSVTPVKSSFTAIQERFGNLGYVQTKVVDPRFRYPRREMRLTEEVVNPFLDTLLFHTTNHGVNLPELLIVPESVTSVIEATDFLDRVVAHVSGIAISSTITDSQ